MYDRIWILLGICIALLAACQSQHGSAGQNQMTAVTQDLQTRYDSAMKNWDMAEKDKLLRRIARDAAGENVPKLALQATGSISDESIKDETAGSAALAFSDRGNRDVALKLIGMMSDPSMREEILEQVSPADTQPSTRK